MPKPFFSVIIPTLNEEDYLPRLLDDLVKQKETSFEVFIVDGGSSDRTISQAEKFLPKLSLTVLVDSANVSIQRNRGARHAQGKYLVFLDADVQIPAKFLLLIRQTLHTKLVDVLTTYVRADSHDAYDDVVSKFANLGMDVSILIDRPFVPGFNFMIQRKFFQTLGGFDPSIKHGEDFDLSLRAYQAGYSVKIIKEPKLTFSLRRYRREGRLKVLRKNAQAAIHIFTKGPITRDIFDYPMGGAWYKHPVVDQNQHRWLVKTERFIKRFIKLWIE